ncbi:MAG: pentapeptide repeat-containing protein, partial [Cyanobacteria bacterium P01_C01_bin.72]
KNLCGVDIIIANLQGVDFEDANLTKAKINNAIIRHSNLNNANLTNTNLIGANICGVDLDRANLKGAKLKSVVSDRHTQLSLKENSSKTNLMVKERPTVKVIPEDSTKIQHNQEQQTQAIASAANKQKSAPNILRILLLGIVAMVTAAGYFFWRQNPDYSWREQIEAGKVKLEQLMP